MKTIKESINEAIVKGKLKQYSNNKDKLHIYKRYKDGYNKEDENVRVVLVENLDMLNTLASKLYYDTIVSDALLIDKSKYLNEIINKFNKSKALYIRPHIDANNSKTYMYGYLPSMYFGYEYECDIDIKDFNYEYWKNNGWDE